MFLKVKVHPGSKKNEVLSREADRFEVYVRAKPVDGKANEAMLDLLSEYLQSPRSRLRLVRGAASRNKIVERIE